MTTRKPSRWPKSTPTALKMNNILQIQYEIRDDTKKPDGMIDIWEQNIFARPVTENHWRWFPAAYSRFLMLFLYRFDFYSATYDLIHKGALQATKEVTDELKKYIAYMDNIIMAVWEDCRQADNAGELNADWRSTDLDEWLLVEYYVGRHTDTAVEAFFARNTFTVLDPMELSELKCYLLSLFGCIMFIISLADWMKYENEKPAWHTGTAVQNHFDGMTKSDRRANHPLCIKWISDGMGTGAVVVDPEDKSEYIDFTIMSSV